MGNVPPALIGREAFCILEGYIHEKISDFDTGGVGGVVDCHLWSVVSGDSDSRIAVQLALQRN